MEQAAFLSDHEQDHAGAKALLEQAAEETPADASIWLMLELCAAKLGDGELRERALETRASLAGVPEWRALLLADLAELRFDRGEHAGAFAALDEAVELRTRASFAVLVLTEQLAHKSEHPEHEARALEAQAAMIVESLMDPLRGDELGIPQARRNAPSAADVWLRASDAHRRRGDVAAATALLDRALEQLPGDPPFPRAPRCGRGVRRHRDHGEARPRRAGSGSRRRSRRGALATRGRSLSPPKATALRR